MYLTKIWIFLSLLFQGVLYGQSIAFNELTPENGLSTTVNYHIFQDSYHLIWISSVNGLNCFDGHKNVVFKSDPEDKCSLRDNTIQSGFEEDATHNIWFATFTSVECYERKSGCFKHYFLKDSLNSIVAGYYFIGLDKIGGAWCIVDNKNLYRIDIATGIFEKKSQNLTHSYGGKIVLDQEGEAIFCIAIPINEKNIGLPLHHLKGKNKGKVDSIFNGKNGQPFWQNGEIQVQDNKIIWVALANGGLASYNIFTKVYTTWETSKYNNSEIITGFDIEGSDKVWVGSKKSGLSLRKLSNGEVLQNFQNNSTNLQSPPNKRIPKIYRAKDESIWTSITNVGINFFYPNKNRFKPVFSDNVRGEKKYPFNFKNLVKFSDGTIWSNFYGQGIGKVDVDEKGLTMLSESNQTKYSTYFFEDNKHRKWNLSWYGLGLWDEKINKFQEIDSLPLLFGITLADSNTLLAGYKGGVFKLIDKKGKYSIEKIPEFPENIPFLSMYEDKQKRLWLSQNGDKLVLYEKENQKWKLKKTFEITGLYYAYWEDNSTNTLWCANSEGLLKIDLNKLTFKLFTEKNGLPNSSVNSMIYDSLGFLWLGTNHGIVQFDLKKEIFRGFDHSDGLAGLTFNNFSALKKDNDEFWFGCENGLVSFQPTNFKLIENKSQPIVTKILINDLPNNSLICKETKATNVQLIRSLRLEPDQKTISFEFVLPEYTNPSKNTYRYQLEGLDENPVESGTRGFARYANLKPGHYTLLIWAANSDLQGTTTPTRIKIYLKPPFYATIPFFIACFLSFSFLSWLVFRNYRLRKERIHKIEMEKAIEIERIQRDANEKSIRVEMEKAIEIERIQRDANEKSIRIEMENAIEIERIKRNATIYELRSLRALITPHFFFNALNPLNSYILNNNREKANAYLSKFSSLMRQTLDNSTKQSLTLQDELKFIENYIEIENERATFPFIYTLTIAPDVDIYNTYVPSMIFQPFIENSIWHGIKNLKERSGILTLDIKSTKNSFLVISIQDNGVGREEAAIQRKRQNPKHESKGMKITLDRLEKLAVGNKVIFTDLKSIDGKALGTKVEIYIEIDDN
jgi:hypothetical protein